MPVDDHGYVRNAQPATLRYLLTVAVRHLEAAGIENPTMEAQLLMAHCRGGSRLDVIRDLECEVEQCVRDTFDILVDRRLQREPLAYLRATQEFYGLEFAVTSAVLIPRPETELLVDFAVQKLGPHSRATIVDVGTGSGCIAVAIAKMLPYAQVVAVDISAEALAVAHRNAVTNGVIERVRFVHASLLSSLAHGAADLVVSNPPYIPTQEITLLQPEVRGYEPLGALDGGSDGMRCHIPLVRQAAQALRPGGWVAIEAAMGQTRHVVTLLQDNGFVEAACIPDLAQIDRIAIGRRP